MAFVTKYKSEFTDDLWVIWKTEIQKDGASFVSALQASGDPLLIEYYGEDDILDTHIKGSKLTINVESPSNFMLSDLFTSDPFEYKVLTSVAKMFKMGRWHTSTYDTWVAQKSTIITAVSTYPTSPAVTREAFCDGPFTVSAGQKIIAECHLDLRSGEAPYLLLWNMSGGFNSSLVQLADGDNAIELEASVAKTDQGLWIRNTTATDFTLTDLVVHKEYSTKWSGYLQVDNYQEPYNAPPFSVSLVAVDGLGLLKNFMFSELSYTTRQKMSVVIHDILDLVGITQFTEYVNLYEDTIDDDVDDSLLDQSGVDPDLFEDKTCYDALETILISLNAGIRQGKNGNFEIFRYKELTGITMYGRTFTDGTTKSATTKLPAQYIKRSAVNLITTWNNYAAPTDYETLTAVGTAITSLINSSGSGCATTNSFTVYDGEVVFILFTATINSGTAPYVYIINTGWTLSDSIQVVAGLNCISLTASWDGDAYIALYNNATNVNMSISTVYVSRQSAPLIPSYFEDLEGGMLMVLPQGKTLDWTQDYGNRASLLKNHDFKPETITGSPRTAEHWTNLGSATLYSMLTYPEMGTNGVVMDGEAGAGGTDAIKQSINYISDSATDDLVMIFEYALYYSGVSKAADLRILISSDDGAGNRDDFDGSAWQPYPTASIITLESGTYGGGWTEWKTVSYSVGSVPNKGTIDVTLYAAASDTGEVKSAFRNVSFYFTDALTASPQEISGTVALNTYGILIDKTYVLGDGFDIDNDPAQNKGAINLYDGSDYIATTLEWHTRGNTEADPLTELIANEVGGQYDRARHIIDLPVRETDSDTTLDLNGNIQDHLNILSAVPRIFAVSRALLKAKSRDWNLTLTEIV